MKVQEGTIDGDACSPDTLSRRIASIKERITHIIVSSSYSGDGATASVEPSVDRMVTSQSSEKRNKAAVTSQISTAIEARNGGVDIQSDNGREMLHTVRLQPSPLVLTTSGVQMKQGQDSVAMQPSSTPSAAPVGLIAPHRYPPYYPLDSNQRASSSHGAVAVSPPGAYRPSSRRKTRPNSAYNGSSIPIARQQYAPRASRGSSGEILQLLSLSNHRRMNDYNSSRRRGTISRVWDAASSSPSSPILTGTRTDHQIATPLHSSVSQRDSSTVSAAEVMRERLVTGRIRVMEFMNQSRGRGLVTPFAASAAATGAYSQYISLLSRGGDGGGAINNYPRPATAGASPQTMEHLAQMEVVHRKKRQGEGASEVSSARVSGSEDQKQEEEEDQCCICLEELVPGGPCTLLPCKHIFHPKCIRAWYLRSSCCPLCKHVMK